MPALVVGRVCRIRRFSPEYTGRPQGQSLGVEPGISVDEASRSTNWGRNLKVVCDPDNLGVMEEDLEHRTAFEQGQNISKL
jgi:hypothetical protein